MCGRLLVILIAGTFLIACEKKQVAVTASCSSRVSTVYAAASEPSYCTTVTNHGGVTITGTAVYDARVLGVGGLTSTDMARPIRFAEIEVLNSAGTRIQCGETDMNGDFILDLPTGSPLTVRVNSRSARLSSFTTPLVNPNINASVLNCPEENRYYSVSGSLTPAASGPMATIIAPFTGSVVAGAFNIYDQFVSANLFLADTAQAGNCNGTGGGADFNCTEFTVAPKVSAYWVPGFNPNSYFNSPDEGISFYLPGNSRLFIMGGIDGDVDDSDTDHFDNAVILHEYGHFLEDAYTLTDSPGGPHSGGQIDPRLAWSEGWGNFIQAAIRNTACYTDTVGHSANASYIFNLPLESGLIGCSDTASHMNFDIPTSGVAGEGNFREFTVTRMLWDIFDPAGGATDGVNDDVNNEFNQLWSAITSAAGFNDTTEAFRSVGLIHEIQQDFGTAANPTTPVGDDWSTIRTTHFQADGREQYAQRVIDNVGGCTYTITPGGTTSSNLLRGNDFFFYKHTGGPLTIQLNYTASGAPEPDVDLYVYDEDARLGSSSDIVMSADAQPTGTFVTPETETASHSNLAAGNYLIRVLVFATGSAFTYDLRVTDNNSTGVDLCPAP